MAKQGDQQDHRHRHAHEGHGAALFKPTHRSPLRRVLSSNPRLLAQPNALLWPSLFRSLVRGLGQQDDQLN
jgi:hypothetical protein